MLLNSILHYFSIGFIFTLFSIALRSSFLAHIYNSPFDIAIFLENMFLLCIVLTVILSWNIRIEWSGNFYLWISIILGLLIIVGIIVSFISSITDILYYIPATSAPLLYALRVAGAFFDIRGVLFLELFKGSIYLLFLTPILQIVVGIYSIWNIHKVSWGSNPDKNNKNKSESLRKLELEYKNYRSNFLLIWCFCNLFVAKYIQLSYTEDYDWVILAFLWFKILFFAIQLMVFAISKLKDWYINLLIEEHKSDYFEKVSFNKNCIEMIIKQTNCLYW